MVNLYECGVVAFSDKIRVYNPFDEIKKSTKYRKVAISNTSRFQIVYEGNSWYPFCKTFIFELVTPVRTHNSTVFGRFLKKLCLYFAREGMVIDLVFWSSFSAAVWITTPMEKHLLKLIPTIYDMHYVCWNWILQIPIQFNWMVMDMFVSRKFSSLLDYLVKYILYTSQYSYRKVKRFKGVI